MPFTRPMMIALLALVLPVLAACSTNPATGEQSFTAFMSQDSEAGVGRTEHPKILKQFGGVYSNARLSTYVDGIGQKLAAQSEMKTLKFTFTVLNDEAVNAFALPGGYVYVTRGLLALAENEAELAAVLSHEIGHVTARHTAQRYSQSVLAQIGVSVLGAVSGRRVVADIAGLGAGAYLQSFSREHEMEADTLAVRYMVWNGYRADATVSFFKKMKAQKELASKMNGLGDGGDEVGIMSTHPRTTDRIAQAIKLAKQTPSDRQILGRDRFLRQIDGIIYGDDPAQGVRRGQTFTHPGLRLTFSVPKGFALFNSPTQVVARNRDGAIILFDGESRKINPAISLTDYIQDIWLPQIDLRVVERLRVGGMEAATARASVRTSGGAKDLRVVVYRHPKGIYRLTFLTDQGRSDRLSQEFRRTTYSFRQISVREARAVKPYRLRVFKIESGQQKPELARRMAPGIGADELFQVLNANVLRKPLRGGVQVKIVRAPG